VTSAPSAAGIVANLVLAEGRAWATQTPHLAQSPKGTGDIFGALYLASRLDGEPPARALERATAGVYAILTLTLERQSRELDLVRGQDRLADRACPFAARPIQPLETGA